MTFRAVVVGAVLIPLNILWVTHVEYVRYSDNVSTSALFFNAIALLLLLTALNSGLKKASPRLELTRAELLCIYVMVMVSTALAGHDQMQILFSTISYIIERPTPENRWGELILPHLPVHLVPARGSAVSDLYSGHSSLYSREHIIAWLPPLAWWASFVLAGVFVMMCMAAIFRRQWDAERLTYPIAEIPLRMTDPRGRLFANRLFWIAFGLASLARLGVVVHLLVPSIPALPINVEYHQITNDLPWSAANPIPVSFFPFAIGLSFFLPTHLSFSVWIFFIITRLEKVASAAMGFTTGDDFPYLTEQGVGCAVGLGLAVLYYARKHLRRVTLHAFGRSRLDDASEPMPYSLAFWGMLGGFLYMVLFAASAGLRLWTAAVFLVIVMLFVLVTARLRAEVGLPTIEIYTAGADRILRNVAGDAAWGRPELTAMSLMFWMVRTHRQFPMSGQVDGLRIADRAGISQRQMTALLLSAAGIAIVSAFWAYLHVLYQVGYESGRYSQLILTSFGAAPWENAAAAISNPQPAHPGKTGAYVFGAGITLLLSFLRVKFIGWPLHPVGFLTATSWGLMRLWVPVLIAWIVKVSLLRYGGLTAYQTATPFFLGLICGEFVVGMIVSLLGFYGVLLVPPQAGIGGL